VPQRGFGAAAHAGLLTATTEVVAFMDADGSFDPQQLPRVCDPVCHRRAVLVLGRRRPTQRLVGARAHPRIQRVAGRSGWRACITVSVVRRHRSALGVAG
jgi:Glycosyl transferase family 2